MRGRWHVSCYGFQYSKFTMQLNMGGDQCQNLQLFLFSTKIMTHYHISFAPSRSTYKWYSLICMVKFYIQMILSHLHGEVLHTNESFYKQRKVLHIREKFYIIIQNNEHTKGSFTSNVKFYIQMRYKYDKNMRYKRHSLNCMVKLLYWKPLPEKRDLPATCTQRRDTIITSM